MPYSLVLNLLPQSPIPPGYLRGRHLHALFLTLVSSVDRQLGDRLHESSAEKAFTLSPLQTCQLRTAKHCTLQREQTDPIPAHTPCWWRISLLDDDLFGQLTDLWLNLNPTRPWHLGPADLYITSILGTPQPTQPWANACPYTQLYEQASESNCTFAFSLATPVCFRQGKYDTVLPTRENIFGSLLSKWNKYSPISIPSLPIESIFASYVKAHTETVAESSTDVRNKFMGLVGEVTYRLMGPMDAEVVKQVNAIADFALYSGIGRKTPMGMGMVRRMPMR